MQSKVLWAALSHLTLLNWKLVSHANLGRSGEQGSMLSLLLHSCHPRSILLPLISDLQWSVPFYILESFLSGQESSMIDVCRVRLYIRCYTCILIWVTKMTVNLWCQLFFPDFKPQLVKLPSHDCYEFDSHYITMYVNTYVPTYLQRWIILFYIEKQCAHSGEECGFWSQIIEETKAPEIATCPRSHISGHIYKRICSWVWLTPVAILWTAFSLSSQPCFSVCFISA